MNKTPASRHSSPPNDDDIGRQYKPPPQGHIQYAHVLGVTLSRWQSLADSGDQGLSFSEIVRKVVAKIEPCRGLFWS
ncbi:hypothetical protein THAOC_33849 [Thalassiosira oceanica]|uniref:Uncharacterized protein n=1 Tax=Thalassiosira oceanica TaxID=159749 RepID=K0R659_THAOC|nr:hypothetical protein THAOC_33849 [Thalassiosira oceanica]|eukprot:EJK47424.1 hypothetical protein THAOC_33849 [Thalassiosira oceanica]